MRRFVLRTKSVGKLRREGGEWSPSIVYEDGVRVEPTIENTAWLYKQPVPPPLLPPPPS